MFKIEVNTDDGEKLLNREIKIHKDNIEVMESDQTEWNKKCQECKALVKKGAMYLLTQRCFKKQPQEFYICGSCDASKSDLMKKAVFLKVYCPGTVELLM